MKFPSSVEINTVVKTFHRGQLRLSILFVVVHSCKTERISVCLSTSMQIRGKVSKICQPPWNIYKCGPGPFPNLFYPVVLCHCKDDCHFLQYSFLTAYACDNIFQFRYICTLILHVHPHFWHLHIWYSKDVEYELPEPYPRSFHRSFHYYKIIAFLFSLLIYGVSHSLHNFARLTLLSGHLLSVFNTVPFADFFSKCW